MRSGPPRGAGGAGRQRQPPPPPPPPPASSSGGDILPSRSTIQLIIAVRNAATPRSIVKTTRPPMASIYHPSPDDKQQCRSIAQVHGVRHVAGDPAMVSLVDYETEAERRLSPAAAAYYRSGAGDEQSLRENAEAWKRFRLLPRMLVGVGERNTATTVLGAPVRFPVLLAPTAMQRLAHPDGELATARAAAAAGTIMTLSTVATASIEQVAEARASVARSEEHTSELQSP